MTDKPDLAALFGSSASTFMGIEACTDLNSLKAPVALIGAPCASPYSAVGAYCRHAPDALREATVPLAANLWHYDFDLGGPVFPSAELAAVDCGNLPFDGPMPPATARSSARRSPPSGRAARCRSPSAATIPSRSR